MDDLERSLKNLMNERLDPLQPKEVHMQSLRKATMLRILTSTGILLTGIALVAAGWWGASAWGDGSDIDPAGGTLYICRVDSLPREMTVFLRDDVTQTEIQALNIQIGNLEEVEFVTFVSKADAFEEFKERYRNQPQFYENLPPDALPASLRVELKDDVDAEEVASLIQGAPGIDDIRYATYDPPCMPIEPYDG